MVSRPSLPWHPSCAFTVQDDTDAVSVLKEMRLVCKDAHTYYLLGSAKRPVVLPFHLMIQSANEPTRLMARSVPWHAVFHKRIAAERNQRIEKLCVKLQETAPMPYHDVNNKMDSGDPEKYPMLLRVHEYVWRMTRGDHGDHHGDAARVASLRTMCDVFRWSMLPRLRLPDAMVRVQIGVQIDQLCIASAMISDMVSGTLDLPWTSPESAEISAAISAARHAAAESMASVTELGDSARRSWACRDSIAADSIATATDKLLAVVDAVEHELVNLKDPADSGSDPEAELPVNGLVVSNVGEEGDMETTMCVIALLSSTRGLRSADLPVMRSANTPAHIRVFQLLRERHAATLTDLCLRQVGGGGLRSDALAGLHNLRTLRMQNAPFSPCLKIMDLLKALQGLRVERVVISTNTDYCLDHTPSIAPSDQVPSVRRLEVLVPVTFTNVYPECVILFASLHKLLSGFPNLTSLDLSGGIVVSYTSCLERLLRLQESAPSATTVSRLTLKQYDFHFWTAFKVSSDILIPARDVELWLNCRLQSFDLSSAAYLASCETLRHLPTMKELRLVVAVHPACLVPEQAYHWSKLAAMVASLIRTALPPLVRRVSIVPSARPRGSHGSQDGKIQLTNVFAERDQEELFKAAAERGVQLQLNDE